MNDPFDYSRSVVAEHAARAAMYADTLHGMAEIRDDDAAVHAMQRLVYEVRSANDALKLIIAENHRRKAEVSK